MKLFMIIMIIMLASLISLFSFGIRGYGGAIILGLVAAGSDFLWQWLRFKFSNQQRISWVILLIFTGFAIRPLSIFGFLKIAIWWLGYKSPQFNIFIGSLILMILILSLVAAYKMKRETE